MQITFERKTIAHSIEFVGVGIHTGLESSVEIRPGSRGVWFHYKGDEYEAKPSNVSKTPRSTWLGPLRTVEHLLSAISGLGVTDAEIHVHKNPELPILDGASLSFAKGLISAVVTNINICSTFELFGRAHSQKDRFRIAVSAGTGKWKYEFDTGARWPGKQLFEFDFKTDDYLTDIAPARTITMEEEIDQLLAMGLGKGGTAQNTLILGKDGYLSPCLFENEPARHKMLDCIGDLALSGIPPHFLNVSAVGSGHEMNVEVSKRIVELCKWTKI